MKFTNILSAAALTIVASATGAFAQDATYMDMSQMQGGEVIQMGITEATTDDGAAFAAGMLINPEYGTALSVDSTVLRIEKEEYGTETAADGSIIADENSIEKTVSASGTVNFGNKVENTDDIDGSEIEVEGNSNSVDL